LYRCTFRRHLPLKSNNASIMSKSKSPSLRRIQADIRELALDPSDQYYAAPLESDMFEWHFTIRGAAGTDFEGGIYHGRILLPPEYPFKPPHIIFLTPSGRFETNTKICLSFSAYHPELWQPAWGIRLILEALISFLPTPADGAIGALDWKPSERRRLAKQSVDFRCAKCCGGGKVADQLPELKPKSSTDEEEDSDGKKKKSSSRFQKEIEQLQLLQMQNEQPKNEKKEDDDEGKKDEGAKKKDTAGIAEESASKQQDGETKIDDTTATTATTATTNITSRAKEETKAVEEGDSKPVGATLPPSNVAAASTATAEDKEETAATATAPQASDTVPLLEEPAQNVARGQQQHLRNEAHGAAQIGNLVALRQIARSSQHLLYEQDENGWTPLHEACRSGHREVVQLIYMLKKSEIHVVTGGQQTPLDLVLEYHGAQHSLTRYLKAMGAKTYTEQHAQMQDQEEERRPATGGNEQIEQLQQFIPQRHDEDVFGWLTDTTLQFMFGILLVICYLFAKKGYDLYEELQELHEQLESMD